MTVCSLCGTAADPIGAEADETDGIDETDEARPLPLTWVTSTENGRVRVYCDRCARDHLRSIEAKLDSEYW